VGTAADDPSPGASPVGGRTRSPGHDGDDGRARPHGDSDHDADQARADDNADQDDSDDHGGSHDDHRADRPVPTAPSPGLFGLFDSLADALTSIG
jgi:hypothetical protein